MLLGKYILLSRKEFNRQVEFSIIPDAASGLRPGDFFYLLTSVTNFVSFYTGKVLDDGGLVCQTVVPDGVYQGLLYRSDFNLPLSLTISVFDNKISQTYKDCIIALGNEDQQRRVFRTESTDINEEGEVTITASLYVPLDLDDSNFIIED